MNFLDADYSAIEARIVNWLAGQEDALERFRRYDAAPTEAEKHALDPYRLMASTIYGIPVAQVLPFPHRFIGKGAELGCGFGLGPPKFRKNCKEKGGYDLPLGLEVKAVKTWRATHKKTVQFWYDLEGAAKHAIVKKNVIFPVGKHLSFLSRDIEGLHFLLMKLPSGRKLAYPKPKIVNDRITFFGQIPMTKKWSENISIWGGTLANNCLSGDTQIFTQRGWIRLQTLTTLDWVWDGSEFVQHQGLVNKGVQPIIEFEGVKLTRDHLLLSEEGWITAQTACMNPHIQLSSAHGHTTSLGTFEFAGSEVRSFDRHRKGFGERKKNHMGMQMRLWKYGGKDRPRNQKASSKRMYASVPFECRCYFQGADISWNDHASRIPRSGSNAGAMLQSQAPSMAQLRREGDWRVRAVAGVIRELLGGHGADVSAGAGHRPQGQQRGLHTRKLPVGHARTKYSQHAEEHKYSGGTSRLLGRCTPEGHQTQHVVLPLQSRTELGADHQHSTGLSEQVYDILNCGPRNCFAIKSERGRLLIAHNCTQAVAADLMANGAHNAEREGYAIATLIHDQCLTYKREGQTAKRLVELLTQLPPWASGLPLAAEGSEVPFYRKE